MLVDDNGGHHSQSPPSRYNKSKLYQAIKKVRYTSVFGGNMQEVADKYEKLKRS